MKTLHVFLLVASLSFTAFAQGNYTATVVTDDVYWENQNEWIASFHSELRLDGVLQQPSGSNYYGWWYREQDDPSFVLWATSGYGNWISGVDDEHDQTYYVYVKITLPGGQIVPWTGLK